MTWKKMGSCMTITIFIPDAAKNSGKRLGFPKFSVYGYGNYMEKMAWTRHCMKVWPIVVSWEC